MRLRFGIDAELSAMIAEGFGERGGGRDRIPGCNRSPAIDATERGGIVAADEDAVADRVGPCERETAGTRQMLARIVVAEPERFHVGRDELFLTLELGGDGVFDDLG